MRLKIFRVIITAWFFTTLGGLVYVQAIRGDYYYNLSTNNRIRVVSLEGKRGRIFDRNGIILADNRLSFDVMVVPQEIKDKEVLFKYLSTTLNVDKEKLLKTFKQKQLAPFSPVTVAEDVSRETAISLEENKFLYPGLTIEASAKRYFPFGAADAHLIGYVGKINRSKITQLKDYGYTVQNIVGYSGVEEYYDSFLKGEDGGLQIEVNNRGQQVRLLGIKDSLSGQDITLTIDNRIQAAAAELLQGRKGAIVVLNLDTDEVLGLVSSPSFDPNDFVEGKPSISSFFADPAAPLLNRATSGQYPPGSTFKIPESICALEKGKITPDTTFNCPGYYQLGRRQFRCSHTHGVQNLTEGIAHSCNVYFFNVGLRLGPDLLAQYARMLHLGSPTNIDLPYEASGLIPDRAQRKASRHLGWYNGDTLNFAIGQGDVLTTPLQLAVMMGMVAKDGVPVHPFVIKAIGSQNVERYIPETQRAEISQSTLDVVKAGMRAAVGDYSGTAHILDFPNLLVLGKTGTAQTSGNREPHAWFAGYCPTAKTKIVFCVFLEFGGSSYYACQVAKDLLQRMMGDQIL